MQRQDILERLFVEYFHRETMSFNNKDVETKICLSFKRRPINKGAKLTFLFMSCTALNFLQF